MQRKWIGFLFLGILGASLGIAASMKPWQKHKEQTQATKVIKDELKQAEREHAELVRQQAKVQTDIGQEGLARDRGYKRADETPWEGKKTR